MNLFKIMQGIRAMAQAGKIDFPGAVVYLQKLGVKMDGIVHQALKNVFKEGKARDVEFGNVVKDFPIDDAGIPFNPNTLKSTAEKRGIRGTSEADRDIAFIQEGIDDLNKAEREADLISEGLVKGKNKEGVETLFEEVKVSPKEVKYGNLDYDRIARVEGVDVEEIRGKSFREIIEYLAAVRDKADGGRVGFKKGGWDPGAGRDTKGYQKTSPHYSGGDGGNQGIKTIPVKDIPIGVNEFNNLIKPGLTNYHKKYTDILKKYSTDEFGKWQNLDPSLITEEEGKILEPYGTSIWSDMAKEDPAKFFELYRGKQTDSPGVPPRDWQDPDVDRAPLYNWVKDGGRVGFVEGGWADDLTGSGLAIYNSMMSAGHTEQDIQDTLKQLGYWSADGDATETVESIVNIGADTTQGGDNIPVGPTSSDFQTVLDTRQKRLQDPSKIASFIGNYIPQQRSVQDMLTSGVKDQRLTSGLPWGLSGLAAKMLPDKYYDMPLGDQAFIQSQMGYTDPQTNMANKDPFGINVRSMFGNYADFVTDEVSKLEEIVADQLRRGLIDTHQMKRLNYYKPLSMQRKNIQSDVGLINLAKQKEQEAAAAQAVTSLNELTSQASGGGGRGIASAGVASGRVDPAGMGGGSRQATSAGAQKTDRSDKGWGWREGGLATMFTRRR